MSTDTRRRIGRSIGLFVTMALLPTVFPHPATAATLAGDLNGDGAVSAEDEPWLLQGLGASVGDPSSGYEPAADLDANGVVDVSDLALFGASFGLATGDPDLVAPGLSVTLNDIPVAMSGLLVVPPDSFQITLLFDSGGGSAIDVASLSVTSSEGIGAYPAGAELAALFDVSPTRAVWEVPSGTDLARTSHYLTVAIADAAGNSANDTYGYAVRDFEYGAPLENLQTVFLDFEQDRSLGPDVDFLEDLRSYGLSTATKPFFENNVRRVIAQLVVERVTAYFSQNGPGAPFDPVNIVFTSDEPAGPHSRLCVGGESSSGPAYLGSSIQDDQNLSEYSDDCQLGAVHGVFPQAIRSLWGANPDFVAVFAPFDSSQGGIPLGLDISDGYILSLASQGELEDLLLVEGRPTDIANAVGAFTQVVATAIAHEVGHMLGLTARGAAPAGLFGGEGGADQDHNVTVGGGVPAENYLMNRGSSFTFPEMAGRQGEPLPTFRELNWAYLHDRVALDSAVTGLFPAPEIYAVGPNPAIYTGPWTPLSITIHGDGFLAQPTLPVVQLIVEGDPTPNPISGLQVLDAQTITGQINPILIPAGLYDVKVINPDGQEVIVTDLLDVQGP